MSKLYRYLKPNGEAMVKHRLLFLQKKVIDCNYTNKNYQY